MKVRATIIGPGGRTADIDLLVDTGAFYTVLSPDVAEDLAIQFPVTQRAVTADSRSVELPLGIAEIRLDGRSAGILVGKLEVPEPILGVSALEALGFKVNPVDGTLEPTRAFPEIPLL